MSESGWTVDTLKAHVEALREADEKAVQTALAAAEKRLDGMNEFRASLSDQSRTLMPRAEAEAIEKAQNERIDRLARADDERRAARGGLSTGWGVALAILGLVALAISLFGR